MDNMGEIIKTLRIHKGITQEELGKVIGVQKSAIRKYESGLVQNIKRTSIKKWQTTSESPLPIFLDMKIVR